MSEKSRVQKAAGFVRGRKKGFSLGALAVVGVLGFLLLKGRR